MTTHKRKTWLRLIQRSAEYIKESNDKELRDLAAKMIVDLVTLELKRLNDFDDFDEEPVL